MILLMLCDQVVVALHDIFLEPQHTQFHDFRKLIRSILFVLSHFPDLLLADNGQGVRSGGAPQLVHGPSRTHSRDRLQDQEYDSASHDSVMDAYRHTAHRLGQRKAAARRLHVLSSAWSHMVVKCNPLVVVDRLSALYKSLGQVR